MTDDIIFIPFLEICPFVRVWVRAQPRSKTSLVLLGLRVKYFLRKWDRKIQASFIKCLFSVLQTYSPVTSILFFFWRVWTLWTQWKRLSPLDFWVHTTFGQLRSHGKRSEEETEKVRFYVPWIFPWDVAQAVFPWNVPVPLKMTLPIELSILMLGTTCPQFLV